MSDPAIFPGMLVQNEHVGGSVGGFVQRHKWLVAILVVVVILLVHAYWVSHRQTKNCGSLTGKARQLCVRAYSACQGNQACQGALLPCVQGWGAVVNAPNLASAQAAATAEAGQIQACNALSSALTPAAKTVVSNVIAQNASALSP